MNAQGRTIKVWTQRQLDAALEALKKATDWTIEEIKKIDWMQVIAVGTVVILVIAIGVAVTFFTAGAGTAPYAASVQAFLTSTGGKPIQNWSSNINERKNDEYKFLDIYARHRETYGKQPMTDSKSRYNHLKEILK